MFKLEQCLVVIAYFRLFFQLRRCFYMTVHTYFTVTMSFFYITCFGKQKNDLKASRHMFTAYEQDNKIE